MGKQVWKKTLIFSRITLPLKHTRNFIFLVFIKNPFCEEDMLHLPLFLDTGGFVLPIPCPVAETVAHNTHTEDSFHSGKECLSLLSPLLLFYGSFLPVCLIYHCCNFQVLVCLLSSGPVFPILLNCLIWSPFAAGKQNWGVNFMNLEDVTHAQGKACF